MILYNANDGREKIAAEDCGAELLKLCVDAGGCLTGEHGVGIEKRELMRYQYTEADLIQQMRVKAAFDPDGFSIRARFFRSIFRNALGPERI